MRLLTAVALLMLTPAVAMAASGGAESFSFTACFLQMSASLAVIVGAIYLMAHLSRRWLTGGGGGAGRSYIRVVESRSLAPKKSLLLVEVAGEYLLLSNGNDGINLIKQIDMLEEIDVLEPVGQSMFPAGRLQESFEQIMTRVSLPRFLASHLRSEG